MKTLVFIVFYDILLNIFGFWKNTAFEDVTFNCDGLTMDQTINHFIKNDKCRIYISVVKIIVSCSSNFNCKATRANKLVNKLIRPRSSATILIINKSFRLFDQEKSLIGLFVSSRFFNSFGFGLLLKQNKRLEDATLDTVTGVLFHRLND